ncbi:MAG: hypothetical protein GX542_05035 [Rhodococcus sp.]|nr:hypothetical protein [Rhodococcus sp. (in: high G+C Gram-positive bacteria)]
MTENDQRLAAWGARHTSESSSAMPSLDDLILDAVLDLLQTRGDKDLVFRDRACSQLLHLLQARARLHEPALETV